MRFENAHACWLRSEGKSRVGKVFLVPRVV